MALIGLSAVAVTFALVLWRRRNLRDTVIAASTYVLGLSLLLATSLRGWYVTGHDIQTEYRVFQLTKDRGVWNIGTYHNAYNACLSITILPTEIWQVVRVDDPYVYKFFFQMLFAAVPVLVYLLARRYWSKRVAILGVVYFVGFPTFFTDMPFLNRQEIAFIFVGLAFLAMTRRQWSVWRRRLVMVVCALGTGLSHYSTMYVFIGTLAIGLIAEYGYLLFGRLRQKPKHERPVTWVDTARIVTLGVVIASGLMAVVWSGLITHTSNGGGNDRTGSTRHPRRSPIPRSLLQHFLWRHYAKPAAAPRYVSKADPTYSKEGRFGPLLTPREFGRSDSRP